MVAEPIARPAEQPAHHPVASPRPPVVGPGQTGEASGLPRFAQADLLAQAFGPGQATPAPATTLAASPAPGAVAVPEPTANFDPAARYPWQNEALRATIYPFRDQQLSFFLRTFGEIDLDAPGATVSEPSAEDWGEEREALAAEIKDATARQKTLQTELRQAIKAGGDTAPIGRALRALNARKERLEADLKYLPALHKGKLPPGAARKWTAYQAAKYDDAGKELGHDELLKRVLQRFDADPTFARYPQWLRYMVIHFSGMRYQSAHGSYAPPADLVRRLKREEVRAEQAALSEGEVGDLAEEAAAESEEELEGGAKGKRKTALTRRLANLNAVERTAEKQFTGKADGERRAAFERLRGLEAERESLGAAEESAGQAGGAQGQLDRAERLRVLDAEIAAEEAKIGTRQLRAARKAMDAAAGKRRQALLEHALERAERSLAGLEDTQALAMLQVMRDQGAFPGWVWREIVRVTPLRLEADEDWERQSAEDKAASKGKGAGTASWRAILQGWKKDSTRWRSKHAGDLSLVVVRAVCNEIAEMAQHARGVKPTGGIGQSAVWYAAGKGGASFRRPTGAGDLQPGASLFWLDWQAAPPKGAHSIVRASLPVEFWNEHGDPIKDHSSKPDRDGWVYSFESDGTITRTRKIGTSITPGDEPTEKQHLNWTHEAVVAQVDAKRSRVLTFETGPIGLRTRQLKSVQSSWNVFVGFAPGGGAPPQLDTFLKDVAPEK